MPLCHSELAASDAGAKSVDPSIQTTNTYDGDWNDITKGKQATLAQASQGAAIPGRGGGPASGMVQAIKQENLSGFGDRRGHQPARTEERRRLDDLQPGSVLHGNGP